MPQTLQRSPSAPFIKWAGGKGQLLDQLVPMVPPHRRYLEPFVGGGAMFFRLAPERAVLADANPNLVACYKAVRDEVEALVPILARYRQSHCEAFYYAVRTRYNEGICESSAERAAMFIYLNKTGFNGLYRENSRGGFNVPFGRYVNPSIFDAAVLRAASSALQSADLRCQTFEDTMAGARRGDFVYLDPPYHPVSPTASFTAYTRMAFREHDQERLARLYRDLDARGCRLMLSNSDTPLVRGLYQGFRIERVSATRAINCDGAGRGKVSELVVTNFEPEQPSVT